MSNTNETKETTGNNFDFKHLKLEDMMEYIDKNAPQDKEWFKGVAIVNGVYKHSTAKKEFCNRYNPSKEKNKTKLLLNW